MEYVNRSNPSSIFIEAAFTLFDMIGHSRAHYTIMVAAVASLISLFGLSIVSMGTDPISRAFAEGATIWTDKGDYAPYETVTIYGNGFHPDSTVWIYIYNPQDEVVELTTTTNSTGGFETQFVLGGFQPYYTVIAQDEYQNNAQTTFTDAINVHVSGMVTSDSVGTSKSSFLTTDNVYVQITTTTSGSGDLHAANVDIYVLTGECPPKNNVEFEDPILEAVQNAVYSTAGTFVTQIWPATTTAGDYCAVVDDNKDGKYNNGELYDPFTVTGPVVSTFSVTFNAPTLIGVANSEVVVIVDVGAGDVDVTAGELPKTFSGIADGTEVSYSYQSPLPAGTDTRYRWDSTSGTGSASSLDTQLDSFNLEEDSTVTGHYVLQFWVDYAADGCDLTVDVPDGEWVDDGGSATGTFPDPVTDTDTQCVLDSTDPLGPITGPTTITGYYTTQFWVDYAADGCDLTVDVPDGEWVDDGGSATGTFPDPVTDTDTQCVLDSTDPLGPITGPTTITGYYTTQYRLTLGTDVSGDTTAVPVANVDQDPDGDCAENSNVRTCWYDKDTEVDLEADSPLLISGTLYDFDQWTGDLTGSNNPESLKMDEPKEVTANYNELPLASIVSTPDGCAFDRDTSRDGQQFRLIYTPATTATTYTLRASNPGQYGVSAFAIGESDLTVSLDIPYPFVTQGSVPIHVYTDATLDDNDCFVGLDEYTGFTVGVTTGNHGITTPSGAKGIDLGSHDGNLPGTSKATINISDLPEDGLVFVQVHLDFGLKGTAPYTPINSKLDADYTGGSGKDIPNLTDFNFVVTAGSDVTPLIIENENVFKHDPGVAGLVKTTGEAPVVGATVKIYEKTKLLGTVTTDGDGYYSFYYKYTGKATTLTVKLPEYNAEKSITLKSNGWVYLDFFV